MDRFEIFNEVIKQYNKLEGTIVDLVKKYPGYTRDKFYNDVKKYGYTKDNERNIYIIPDDNIEGQIDILEATGEPQRKEDIKPMETISEEVEKPTEDKPGVKDNIEKVKVSEKMKKTFEIDIDLNQFIKLQSVIEDKTINQWVNDTLWKAIPESTKKIIK